MLPDHIRITSNPGTDLAAFLTQKRYTKIALLADENTLRFCYPLVEKQLPTHTVLNLPAGEEHKKLESCTHIWQQMTQLLLDRHSLLLVLGGGVLGDMGGFCAATYKRGIDFILIPTTLLAQADASIGGKLGIDFQHYKNHIGVFQQPVLTLLHSGFLKTLPAHELRSGFAEVIKHALISDWPLWNEIRSRQLADQDWQKLLRHSAEFKYSIIEQDPTEKGIRKILNAGHTIGHALESYLLENDRKVMHGEAVAAGLVAEGYLSFLKGLMSEESLFGVAAYIQKIFGKIDVKSDELEAVARYALQDKKNKENEILTVLLKQGSAGWDYAISLQDVKEALSFYLSH
jgi:3-dehydroquinate synthase